MRKFRIHLFIILVLIIAAIVWFSYTGQLLAATAEILFFLIALPGIIYVAILFQERGGIDA